MLLKLVKQFSQFLAIHVFQRYRDYIPVTSHSGKDPEPSPESYSKPPSSEPLDNPLSSWLRSTLSSTVKEEEQISSSNSRIMYSTFKNKIHGT